MSPEQAPTGPLTGIKVLDLSKALAGPYATLMLADAGADVIKVERPGGGDDSRGWGPPFAAAEPDPQSAYFLSVNRSKRSIVLDLKAEDDLDRLRRLLVDVDVLVENFRPGVMERLGLSPPALEDLNPRLVVLSISGFGEGGPDGHRSGFDQILQGEAGLMGMTGPAGGPPTRIGVPITDILSGMFGAYGVTAALYERQASGRGQRVTTSLLASAVAAHTYQGTRWLIGGDVPAPDGNHHPTIAPYGAFRCRNGWVNIAVGSEGLWRRFASLVGLEAEGPTYATNSDRMANRELLEDAINDLLSQEDVDVWVERLDEAGVPVGRIRSLDQVYAWDQVEHLGLIDDVVHPTAGALRVPGAPVRWARSGRRVATSPPLLGEHTDAVLAEAVADDPGEGRL